MLGTTEVRLVLAKAVEELEEVMLPTEELAVGLSVGVEGTSLALWLILVPAAPASEAPVPEGFVVPASTLEVDGVELPETVDEAF